MSDGKNGVLRVDFDRRVAETAMQAPMGNPGEEAIRKLTRILLKDLTMVRNAMNRLLMGLVLVASMALTGCDEQKPKQKSETPEKEGGFSLEAPGVDIKLEKGKGLEVNTPGTDVTVNKEGVKVTAPNTEVEAKATKDE